MPACNGESVQLLGKAFRPRKMRREARFRVQGRYRRSRAAQPGRPRQFVMANWKSRDPKRGLDSSLRGLVLRWSCGCHDRSAAPGASRAKEIPDFAYSLCVDRGISSLQRPTAPQVDIIAPALVESLKTPLESTPGRIPLELLHSAAVRCRKGVFERGLHIAGLPMRVELSWRPRGVSYHTACTSHNGRVFEQLLRTVLCFPYKLEQITSCYS